MKPLTIGAALLGACLFGQDLAAQRAPSQEQLIERRSAKLAEAWVKKADWQTDYEKALATAKESGKTVFAYFTRSYSP